MERRRRPLPPQAPEIEPSPASCPATSPPPEHAVAGILDLFLDLSRASVSESHDRAPRTDGCSAELQCSERATIMSGPPRPLDWNEILPMAGPNAGRAAAALPAALNGAVQEQARVEVVLVPLGAEELEALREVWRSRAREASLAHGERPVSDEAAARSLVRVLLATEDGWCEVAPGAVAVLEHVCLAALSRCAMKADADGDREWEERIRTLTPREQEVAALAATGLRASVIARRLFVTEKTVKFHLTAIYRKLGVRGKARLRRLSSSLQTSRCDGALRDGAASAPGTVDHSRTGVCDDRGGASDPRRSPLKAQ